MGTQCAPSLSASMCVCVCVCVCVFVCVLNLPHFHKGGLTDLNF